MVHINKKIQQIFNLYNMFGLSRRRNIKVITAFHTLLSPHSNEVLQDIRLLNIYLINLINHSKINLTCLDLFKNSSTSFDAFMYLSFNNV